MAYLSQMAAGSFTSNGSPRVLEFDGLPDIVRLYYQGDATGSVWIQGNAVPPPPQPSLLKELYWNRNMANGTGLGTQNIDDAPGDSKIFVATGGVSQFVPEAGTLGPAIPVTGINQDNPAVVTAVGHGLVTGDIVAVQSVANMAQINALSFQITVLNANTFQLNGLNSSGFAAAGTGGSVRKVLYPYVWMPNAVTPIAITQAAQAVVTTSWDHRYVVGQSVLLNVPANFGMVQASGLVAEITAVTANTFTLDLNTSGFTAFAFPPSGAPLGQPSISSYSTSGSLVLNPYRNDGFRGVFLGGSVCGANGVLVHYEILQSDFFKSP